MIKDFSIREEIKVVLTEGGVDDSKIDLDIDEIYDSVESDDVMLSMISLSIYEAIKEKLEDDNKHIAEINYQIDIIKKNIVQGLTSRGII